MESDKRQKLTNKLVPAAYYDIFALRIKGYDLKEIAHESGYSYGWIRTLFAKGGVLYDFWRDWVENRKADQIETAIDMAFEHLPDVMRANIKHAMTPYEGAPMARKLIFDLTLGDLTKRADGKQQEQLSSIAELIKAATLAKQQKENEQQQIGNPDRDNEPLAGIAEELPAG